MTGLEWQEQARCAGVDTNLFFVDMPHGRRARKEAVDAVTGPYCKQCPVITQCLTWALTNQEQYGIWGGLAADERDELLKRQGMLA